MDINPSQFPLNLNICKEKKISFANDDAIIVHGACVHNLKNIDAVIPRNKFVVFTGPSGSGKSSLAFDTIYAEGQRRYVESLSTYARQFLEQLEKPDVESISGLSPTISIDQKTTSYNPRSTVGTVTEIYDYLRLLYCRISKPYCWKCKNPIHSQSPHKIVDQILSFSSGTRLAILAPLARGRKGEYQKELEELRRKGFVRVKIDGSVVDLSEEIQLQKNKKHNLSVYIDRLVIQGDLNDLKTRISNSVELGLKLGQGLLILETFDQNKTEETLLSERLACPSCQISYPDPEPRTFSFNSPMGACQTCEGLGTDPKHTLSENLSLEPHSDLGVSIPSDTLESHPCPSCHGNRLKKESLHFKLNKKNISEICHFSIEELFLFFKNLPLTEREKIISEKIISEITQRLNFLCNVGVQYLSLSRTAQSLSGGEAQRIRLATQIGSSLVGVIYVLDEPSIGLHQKDNEKLIATLMKLRDLGNTVIVVEHDQDTIEQADWVLDFGPGAGSEGGVIIASGKVQEILKSKKSVTGKYLRGDLKIPVPQNRRSWSPSQVLRIEGAHQNNLKNLTVQIPLGVMTCVTGVSGSGKSTLVMDILYRSVIKNLYSIDTGNLQLKSIQGLNQIDKVVDIDQSPIGRTPRSNPATYTGVFTLMRDLFAHLPESKIRGYSPGRYSFNIQGGRCETCKGDGIMKIEMHFLPPVYVRCAICHGRRYNRETLDIRYKGKCIADILEMTGADAYLFFDAIPSIKMKLKTLNDVGLGYLQLGQSSTTLSGGEAQRIKLAKELSKRSTGQTLYILDEPSTGLHFDDVNKLISILHTLVNQGNTVVVIEHNLDMIKVADHIIDLGPGGGLLGGQIVAEGTPERVAEKETSETGKFLKKHLLDH